MPFIERIAQESSRRIEPHISNELVQKLNILASNIKKKDIKLEMNKVLPYGLQAIYGTLLNILMVFTMAILLNIFIPTLFVMLAFIITRPFVGGRHLHSSTGCLILSTTLIIITGWLSSFTIGRLGINIELCKILWYSTFGIILELISITKEFNKILVFIEKGISK